ncbi:MAG: cohesin domain-containing protein [Clostridia bacterium]|nr:cohesin domain-containing protein [Clostridia bacterium]
MNKKFIPKIAAAALAVIIAVVAIFVILNLGDPIVSLGSNAALPGDTVEIPLEIDKNHGVLAAQIYIEYDTDNIKFDSYSNGEVFDMCWANEENGKLAIIVVMNDDEESSKDGLVATLKFKAKISADEGDYKLKFDKETMFIDYNPDPNADRLDIKYKSGNITVK